MEFRFCPLCAAALEPLPAGHRDAGRLGCPTGHFVHYDNPPTTVYAFIRDHDGRYLVLQRADEPYAGKWDLPGGFVEAGESPVEALLREVAEETGLTIEILGVIGAYTSTYGDDGRHTVDIGFHAQLAAGQQPADMLLSDESGDARWLALDDFPEPAFAGERAGLADLKAS